MSEREPDAVAAAYFSALEAVTSLPAQKLSTSVEVCGVIIGTQKVRVGCTVTTEPIYCAGPKTTRVGRIHRLDDEWLGGHEVRERIEICVKCLQPWRPADLELGIMRDPASVRPDVAELALVARLDRLRPLAMLIEPRPRDLTFERWVFDLSLWRVYLRPTVGTYAATARIAQEVTEEPEPSAGQVERAISQARSIVQGRMQRRGRMKTWNRDEILAEIARLEARMATAVHLDRIAMEKTLARLRKWAKQGANGRVAA